MIELIIDCEGNAHNADTGKPFPAKAVGVPSKIKYLADMSDLVQVLQKAKDEVISTTLSSDPNFQQALVSHRASGVDLKDFKYDAKFNPDAYVLNVNTPLEALDNPNQYYFKGTIQFYRKV